MTEVIIEECHEVKESAKLGEIRMDSDGRIIMVIEVEKFRGLKPNSRTLKALVLREGRNGCGEDFSTVPREYETLEEIAGRYPKLLTGLITIKGVD